jgi:predicted transglutaminase-like cysteine proteinase
MFARSTRPVLRLGFLCLAVLLGGVLSAEEILLHLSDAVLASAERKYGVAARTRLIDWTTLLSSGKKKSDDEKLRLVNQFFNQIPFISDSEQWSSRDYWATPVELLASNGGDCEDYAIAKYFSLLALGFPVEKLRITYVKALRQPRGEEAHMVLTYYPKANSTPLVLDNLDKEIRLASVRTDLLPIYSFNGAGLWLAKERGSGRPGDQGQIGSPGQISLWKEMMSRMGNELQ